MEADEADRWILEGVEAARSLLDTTGIEVWRTSKLPGTGGGTFDSTVVRLESETRTAIAKLVRRNDFAPDHPRSWRRELEVYQSTWLRERMPSGLGLPEYLGSTTTADAAIIVMAEVSLDDRQARSNDWYGNLAFELGRLNGPSITDPPPWATLGFTASEATEAASLIPGTLADPSPWIAELLDLWLPILERITVAAGDLVDVLDGFPLGLHHLDAFSRNAARVEEEFVLIDWAYAGVAPIGCDAAALISITAMHGDVPGDQLDELHEAVVAGYSRGLASVGTELSDDDLRLAIDVALTLRFARFLQQVNATGDGLVKIAEDVGERPFDEMLTRWMAAAEHLAAGAKRSFALVGQ